MAAAVAKKKEKKNAKGNKENLLFAVKEVMMVELFNVAETPREKVLLFTAFSSEEEDGGCV